MNPVKRILSFILIIMCLAPACAVSEDELKTVRVAVNASETDAVADSSLPICGYAKEYIYALSAHAGWNVEYVICENDDACADAVARGEADVAYEILKTDDNEALFLFPDMPMGSQDYCLYCLKDNSVLRSGDYASYSGKTVGVTWNTDEVVALSVWCGEHDVVINVREYATAEEKEAALISGEIDMAYENSALKTDNMTALAVITSKDYYLIVNAERSDLLTDINAAARRIFENDPYYVDNLEQTYHTASLIDETLDADELIWVENHPVLKIGYTDNYLPFCDTDESGNPNGIIKDIVPDMLAAVGVKDKINIDYIAYADSESMFAALKSGAIDAAFPVSTDIDYAEELGVLITADVIDLSADLAFKETYSSETTQTIAVVRGNTLQEYYTKNVYPSARIVYYDDSEACLRAVNDGSAGSTILNGLRTSALLSADEFGDIVATRLSEPFSFSFAVKKGNTRLLSLINRSISSLSDGFASQYAYEYVGNMGTDTLADFISEHKIGILSIVIVVLAALLTVMVALIIATEKSRRKLKHMKYIDEKLLDGYDSAFIIDVDKNEVRCERKSRLTNIGVFNGKRNYTQMLKRFKSIVLPKYAHEWEKLSNPDYLKEYLSEQDTREYTFIIPGGHTQMARATFMVLERENGIAKRVLLSFFGVDDTSAEIYALQGQLADKSIELEKALDMAQSSNRAKTSFLFNMSHDIRTPMNAILGFTEMALKNLDDRTKLEDCLEKTRQSGALLLSLINSVLEMSRIESGKAELDEKPVKVDNCFDNIDTTMGDLAKQKNIDLRFERGKFTDNYVWADTDRFNRVMVNLISNAIKYTPDGGTVRVKCEQLGRTDETHGQYRFTVADNGIGMSAEFQKNVFSEFAREKSTTMSGVQGSGLGLAVVKSFVELMHGNISVHSVQGEGSTFTVTLPLRLREADIETVRTETVESYDLNGKKILLVDDNELNREIAKDILTDEGVEVEEADDGTTAVEMLRERGADYYDAILMDIQMPIMNGYDATKEIRKMYPRAKLPIIALSANAFAEDRAASLKAGMDEHIAKPIDTNGLVKVMARFV